VEVVVCPAKGCSGVVGVDKVKVWLTEREIVVVADRLPEVPLMVTVTGPGVAETLAVSVNVLVVVVLVGLNDAVTPLGRPEAVKLTLLANPLAAATVMVVTAVPPGVIVKVLGEAESVKLGGGVTVTLTVVVAVIAPEVPVTVTTVVPAAAEPLAVRVKMLVVVVLVGLKDAVTPAGRFEAARLTLPVNPPMSTTAIVLVCPARPGLRTTLPGVAVSVKVAVGTTVRLIVVVSVVLPEVPVMVTVAVPRVAEPLAVSVKVLVVVVLVGLKDAVTPVGRPEAIRLTVPVKPDPGFTVIMLVPLVPSARLTVLGAADSVNPATWPAKAFARL
jgi:hypothetical protein